MSTSVGTQSRAANSRARLDDAWLADHHGRAIATFPSLALLTLERGDAAVGEGDRLGAVIGREDDDGIVELTHALERAAMRTVKG